MTTRSCPHCNAPLTIVSSDEGTHHYACPEHGAVDPKPLWEYEGRLYIRPTGRGVCLEDEDMAHMDDALTEVFKLTFGLGGWTPRIRMTLELLEDE